ASNTHEGDLSWLAPPKTAKGRRKPARGAEVGGGAGPASASA
ncbi:MAG: hypothetical protein QOH37_464, partial [Nocardioidaceae bacterium]|nr:hypothetical protein [Nocardioidaceae bacterium]